MKRILYINLIIILLACFACQGKKDDPASDTADSTASQSKAEVTVSKVKQGPIFKAYTAVGTVMPDDYARIMPKVAGRIKTIHVDEGDIVEKGKLLMEIDTSDYAWALENAIAIMNQAKAQLEKAQRYYFNMEKLHQESAVSDQTFKDTQTAYELSLYAYNQSVVAVKKTEQDLKECSVIAPIAGIVTNKFVNYGELTGPTASSPAFVIMQMDVVKVEVDLPEEAFGYLKIGNQSMVTLDAIQDESFRGKITKVYPTIDPVSRTFKVTISIYNPKLKLRAGMTARTKVIEKAREYSLYTPKSAVMQGETGYFVYKIAGSIVQKSLVGVGIEGDDIFEITAGLSVDDLVVTKGLTGLKDGMEVTVNLAETEESSELQSIPQQHKIQSQLMAMILREPKTHCFDMQTHLSTYSLAICSIEA
ncbi:MAG: efflux RND transporter periplasmic adaptor subunit [Deltaproteobacteria bacterium]|nr:efflux RND transporter periplasmic adaptor subunit [Deltaproteobacteria bacterium]